MSFERLWRELLPVGRYPASGGYRRYAYTGAELECRAWSEQAAGDRDMPVETDRNGNLWAWWGTPGPGAVVTGSHLDSVPDGGAFDGPLGVVSGFAAVDALRAAGFTPARPVAVVAFAEEEGGRFGVACLGSRLLCGGIDPQRARALTDEHGVTPERGCVLSIHVVLGRCQPGFVPTCPETCPAAGGCVLCRHSRSPPRRAGFHSTGTWVRRICSGTSLCPRTRSGWRSRSITRSDTWRRT